MRKRATGDVLRGPVAKTLALLAALGALGCGSGGDERPNLVVVSVDTLTPHRLPAYRREPGLDLPTFEAVAERATVFLDAWSTASWTLPAHVSLMTGLYPDRHGTVSPRTRLGGDVPTLAGYLGGLGYETVAFTGGGFVSGDYGLERGFDRYDEEPDTWLNRARRLWIELTDPEALVVPPFERARRYAAAEACSGPPSFLFAHTYFVHDYFLAAPELVAAAGPRPDTAPERRDYRPCIADVTACTSADWRRMEALYEAAIERLDARLAELLEAADCGPGGRDTVFVLLSDHGEAFRPDDDLIHHGGHLVPELTRIPLMVFGDGVPAGRVPEPVSIVDVLPTLLTLVGRQPRTPIDGESLAGAIGTAGSSVDRSRPLRSFEYLYQWHEGRRRRFRPDAGDPWRPLRSALVWRGYWYETVSDRGPLALATAGTLEEPTDPGVREHLRALAAERPGLVDPAPIEELDPELEEQLRALGYIRD